MKQERRGRKCDRCGGSGKFNGSGPCYRCHRKGYITPEDDRQWDEWLAGNTPKAQETEDEGVDDDRQAVEKELYRLSRKQTVIAKRIGVLATQLQSD